MAGRRGAQVARTMALPDASSFANYDEARVTRAELSWLVDFTNGVVRGSATLFATAEADGASRLVLDTRALKIKAVTMNGGAARWELLEAETCAVRGTPLAVSLPAGLAAKDEVVLAVEYETGAGADCTALQWLAPEKTAGKKHPYVFSQCQAIHARSLLPCQDAPGAKMTYGASVTVPAPLVAVMSAVPKGEPTEDEASGTRTFEFEQAVPIPPYLVAVAAGELESRELGPRSRVWSEPSMVAAGEFEFADTNRYLESAEAIAGPYVWGRYDLLLLPPSFPYGGMENPCLTFVTPTLLAGDRSQANVVAHEIAHSWWGNLVTNATWEHFWLNEGFTVFLERSILRRMFGSKVYDFHALRGWTDLKDDVDRFVRDGNPQYTRLNVDLSSGVDPDDAFSKVPYEKGFAFLAFLERTAGGPDAFEPFLRDYISAHQYKTVDSFVFQAAYQARFPDAAAAVDWEAWLQGEGMPPVDTREYYANDIGASADALAEKWHFCDVLGVGKPDRPEGASPVDVDGWSSEQLGAFLDRLLELRTMVPLNLATLKALDSLYKVSAHGNSEIKCSWLRLAAAAGDKDSLPLAGEMLCSQGRMKYLRPIYRALYRNPELRPFALETFAAARGGYHPIAEKMVAADLCVD